MIRKSVISMAGGSPWSLWGKITQPTMQRDRLQVTMTIASFGQIYTRVSGLSLQLTSVTYLWMSQ